jgi:hypothetical protein
VWGTRAPPCAVLLAGQRETLSTRSHPLPAETDRATEATPVAHRGVANHDLAPACRLKRPARCGYLAVFRAHRRDRGHRHMAEGYGWNLTKETCHVRHLRRHRKLGCDAGTARGPGKRFVALV